MLTIYLYKSLLFNAKHFIPKTSRTVVHRQIFRLHEMHVLEKKRKRGDGHVVSYTRKFVGIYIIILYINV